MFNTSITSVKMLDILPQLIEQGMMQALYIPASAISKDLILTS